MAQRDSGWSTHEKLAGLMSGSFTVHVLGCLEVLLVKLVWSQRFYHGGLVYDGDPQEPAGPESGWAGSS